MRKQQGITLIGLLLTAFVVIIVTMTVMRIIPIYLENYEVKNTITSLNNLNAANFSFDTNANANILRKHLKDQFGIDRFNDLRVEEMTIVPSGENSYIVTVKYAVVKPLMFNISLMFEFNESQEVHIAKS